MGFSPPGSVLSRKGTPYNDRQQTDTRPIVWISLGPIQFFVFSSPLFLQNLPKYSSMPSQLFSCNPSFPLHSISFNLTSSSHSPSSPPPSLSPPFSPPPVPTPPYPLTAPPTPLLDLLETICSRRHKTRTQTNNLLNTFMLSKGNAWSNWQTQCMRGCPTNSLVTD